MGRAEEIGERLAGGGALLDGGPGEVEAESGGGEVEVGPGSVGLAQEGGDDHQQQRAAGEDALSEDDPALAGEHVEFLAPALLEAGGHRPYNVHGEAPGHTGCWRITCRRWSFPAYFDCVPGMIGRKSLAYNTLGGVHRHEGGESWSSDTGPGLTSCWRMP
ncbi:MAG: hypothetical protein ACRC33_14350, partial [Gemmataceae bacterium]